MISVEAYKYFNIFNIFQFYNWRSNRDQTISKSFHSTLYKYKALNLNKCFSFEFNQAID